MANKPSESPDKAAVDELDPELVKLPRPKTRIRPIMAMAIIGICLTIGLRLSGDLRFSWLGDPTAVDGVTALGSEHENQFIELHVRPDRPQALRVVPSRSSTGLVLVPTLGTGGSLWLLLPATPWTAEDATNEVYRGRLQRLSDTNFDEALRSHVADGTVAIRPIPLDSLRGALSSGANDVLDVSGDRFTLASTTAVQIEEVATDLVRVVAVSTDPYRDETSWSLALQNAGVLPPETAPVSSNPDTWTFDVPAPQGLAEIKAKLRASKLFAAQASEIRSMRRGIWSELSLDGDDVLLSNARPGYHTVRVAVSAPPLVASGAFVLDTTEEPNTYWYVIIIVLALAAFALLFALGLYRTIRRN
ncbi:MAG: hypothetical protein GY811_01695 [Myxococcales bacterium]|nr:hypothetical protein [Myxococcales bacterium]